MGTELDPAPLGFRLHSPTGEGEDWLWGFWRSSSWGLWENNLWILGKNSERGMGQDRGGKRGNFISHHCAMDGACLKEQKSQSQQIATGSVTKQALQTRTGSANPAGSANVDRLCKPCQTLCIDRPHSGNGREGHYGGENLVIQRWQGKFPLTLEVKAGAWFPMVALPL